MAKKKKVTYYLCNKWDEVNQEELELLEMPNSKELKAMFKEFDKSKKTSIIFLDWGTSGLVTANSYSGNDNWYVTIATDTKDLSRHYTHCRKTGRTKTELTTLKTNEQTIELFMEIDNQNYDKLKDFLELLEYQDQKRVGDTLEDDFSGFRPYHREEMRKLIEKILDVKPYKETIDRYII